MAEFLSDNAYLAIKPEATAGTAVVPTVFVPLVSETIRTVPNHTPDRRFKGLSWSADDILRGNRMHEGEIVMLADPDNLGHMLNMFFNKGTTTGDATDGYTHPFLVGDGDSYTIEIKRGIYAHRLFGVRINELRFDFTDGQLQIKASIKAMGQVSVAKLGVALSGSETTLTLEDSYDLAPNRGLVVGDTIVVGTDELEITSVNSNGLVVGFGSTSLSYSIGEPIYLKPQTASYSGLQDPFYFGNFLVGIGATESAATTAAGAASTATPVHDLSIIFRNNSLETPRTGRLDPVAILARSRDGEIQFKQLLESENERADFLDRAKQAITIIAKGTHINPDFSTQELLTIKLNNTKMREHNNALTVGEYIVDDKTYDVLYDSGDAQALDIALVNRTAGTAY